MQIQIVNVEIEVGKPGPKGWSKANVTYQVNGQTKRQNVMSFTNPAVYSAVQRYVGETVEVAITKNAKGYDEWAAVSQVDAGSAGASPPVSAGPASSTVPTRVTGSNYETPAERARRQVLIVRQSSLTAALTYLKDRAEPYDIDDLTTSAQILVDWVFDEEDNKEDPNV